MSNKTPKENAKKTKSALRPRPNKTWLLLPVFVLALLLIFVFVTDQQSYEPSVQHPAPSRELCLGNTECLDLEVVDTDALRQKGLSGRQNLASDTGMLFVFKKPAVHCFWMKDMQFSIDMIWLDSQKKVIKIEENAAPESYPKEFCPAGPAMYVLEVNAGQAKSRGITLGQTLAF